MKRGLLIHSEPEEANVRELLQRSEIGKRGDRPQGMQPPKFSDEPLVFCSFYCDGYEEPYQRLGIIFETDANVRYASPIESFHFLKDGIWIPGHERFLFPSIEEMLEAYPSSLEFQQALKRHLESLSPQEVFPKLEKQRAEIRYKADEAHTPGIVHCNEICYSVPLPFKNPMPYYSKEELGRIFRATSSGTLNVNV